ncbi:hypothetical protein B0H63DRAFT_525703 [Podospora didyma]|uniref:DUF3140 domain-containing protein n=1 Tax=Podospora didyma TaxID=330526 RepID=A0AAE0NC18_9PEZI|nr:hypothetical protein B0H63DRAFT_525703 [Podospora didyma]
MVKDTETVIREFNELVNMTADELDEWLEIEASTNSGWTKDKFARGGGSSGETVGHESGRHIVAILRKNPQ